MASNPDQTGEQAVQASEPTPVQQPDGGRPDAGIDKEGEGTANSAPRPKAASERANAIDESTAGDGVTFFEGGDGREAARGDMERGG